MPGPWPRAHHAPAGPPPSPVRRGLGTHSRMESRMVVCTLLATCRDRTRLDWLLAAAIDLLTLAWIAVLVAWWL